ncbi:MAG: NAD-dependent epimerase/dehydratase family protein [Candidatus Diapherotrites archaeon]|nr:NAD-dependent epimerase/dehydratase family protein [Candidatus Diapherotrites archaeon]
MAGNLSGKKILVTGGTGFLGGWLCRALVEEKAKVVVLARDGKKTGSLALHGIEKKVRLAEGSITGFEGMQKIFGAEKPDYCIHLAAQSSVGKGEKAFLETFRANVQGTWNVLESARQSNVKGVVVASSGKVYGEKSAGTVDEGAPLNAATVYGESKAYADRLALAFGKSSGLDVCVTRAGNIYGPKDPNANRLVPNTVMRVLGGKPPVLRGHGKAKRDFVFVKDTAGFYILALSDFGAVKGKAFNVASGRQKTILEAVEAILKETGSKLKPEFVEPAFREEDESVFSVAAAEKIGWRAETAFGDGIRQTVEWYKSVFADKNH